MNGYNEQGELIYTTPKEELIWRLNQWWNGKHPGKPFHWRGLER